MKHQFAPTLLCALTLAACGSQSGVIGERQRGIDNQSVGDGRPDGGSPLQTDPPESSAADAGGESDDSDAPPASNVNEPGPSGPVTSPPSTTDAPGASSTVSEPGASSSPAPTVDLPDEHLSPPDEPCADQTPIDLPAATIAERLAQLILQSEPDAELLAAAAAGELDTYGQVECQAQRLVALPESKAGVTALLQSWLALEAEPDADVSEVLWAQMQTEATDYLERVAEAETSNLAALLQGTDGLLGPELAAHYGVELPSGETEAVVEVPSRVGVLSLGQVTAGLRRIGERGAWIVERFECAALGAPEPSAAVPAPPGTTFRDAYEVGVEPAACQACHTIFDGPGFTFENFSSDGRYVLEEAGQQLDTSGSFTEIDASGATSQVELADAAELAAHMLQSPTVQRCLAQRVFDYALNRDTVTSEVHPPAADVQRISARLESNDGAFRELLVAVTQSRFYWETEPFEPQD